MDTSVTSATNQKENPTSEHGERFGETKENNSTIAAAVLFCPHVNGRLLLRPVCVGLDSAWPAQGRVFRHTAFAPKP